MKEAIARGKSASDFESVPLPEKLLADDLLLEGEESNWEEIVIALIVVVVSQIAFRSGMYWRERRLRIRKDRAAYRIETEVSAWVWLVRQAA